MASVEVQRKIYKPNFSFEEIIYIGKKWFNRNFLNIKKINSYDDQNLRVITSDKELFVFKINNGVDSENMPFIDAQNQFSFHLQNIGILTSIPIKNREGKLNTVWIKKVSNVDGKLINKVFIIRLFTWIKGQDMSKIKPKKYLIQSAGLLLSKIHENSNKFSNISCNRTHAWDLSNLLLLRNFLHVIKECLDKRLVKKVLDQFETNVLPSYTKCEKEVVQNDFNDANLIVDDKKSRVIGLIDFGDICLTYLVNDLAIALAYSMLYNEISELESASIFYRAYSRQRIISKIEKDILWILISGRLTQSVIWSAYSFSKQSENIYLLKHARSAWNILRRLKRKNEKYLVSLLC